MGGCVVCGSSMNAVHVYKTAGASRERMQTPPGGVVTVSVSDVEGNITASHGRTSIDPERRFSGRLSDFLDKSICSVVCIIILSLVFTIVYMLSWPGYNPELQLAGVQPGAGRTQRARGRGAVRGVYDPV
jgi:hypothetical protein